MASEVATGSAAPRAYGLLIDALAARFGGTAYAVIQLARALAARGEVSVTVLTRRNSLVARGLQRDANVSCLLIDAATRLELPRRVLWEAIALPAAVRRRKIDCVITVSGMLPRSPRCSVACLMFNPVMFEVDGAGNALRRFALRRTAAGASFVAAPSGTLAAQASRSIGRECSVVPLGVDHTVFRPSERSGDEILCVADFYAHKRHDILLEAWAALPPPRPSLRLIGDPDVDRATFARVTRLARSLGRHGRVILEPKARFAALLEAYRRARILVVASEHESFCMPLLEGMACAVPAVVRDLASLRETAGEGALYVETDDPEAWSAQLRVLLCDSERYLRMRDAATHRAASFSWERMAGEVTRLLDGS